MYTRHDSFEVFGHRCIENAEWEEVKEDLIYLYTGVESIDAQERNDTGYFDPNPNRDPPCLRKPFFA